ncbi:MAG TPA: polyhydroxyalkanoate synthesis repressor PhaR [Rhizobiales bacterium]|nr:polyhydroxyalkanoate synthesis repressor PhaR [Hyphomicrobiales bacterium]
MSDQDNSDDVTVIKKYANRRLYNTASSSYVTLDDLSSMVKAGEDFVVRDAKSGDDITRSVLTQIIFEEEAKGENLLPINFLRQLIGFYGDSMQAVVPPYLEHAMSVFSQGQENLQEQVANAFGGADVMKMGEEMAKQNMAMFQQAMGSMGTLGGLGPMGAMFNPAAATPEKDQAPAAKPQEQKSTDDFDTLKDQLSAMQRQLDALTKKN